MQRSSAKPSVGVDRPGAGRANVPVGVAFGVWAGCWMLGNLVAGAAVAAANPSGRVADGPTWVLGLAASLGWLPLLVAVGVLGRRFGSGRVDRDFGLSWKRSDLLGVPIGIAVQVAVIPVLYLPLRAVWPSVFTDSALQDNARTLVDQAHGAWIVLLVAVVAIGAPLVEELVFRGLLQQSLARRIPPQWAVPAIAVLFAAIHFRPIEFPGLLVFGLVLGAAAWRTGRLGMGVLAHVAFNVTALLMVM